MTLLLGSNDSVLESKNNGQYVSLDRYKSNLIEIIETIQTLSPWTKIILITPPPVVEKEWEIVNQKNRRDPSFKSDRKVENTKKYHHVCLDVGNQKGVFVVNTWSLFLGPSETYTAQTLEQYLSDGLHLSKQGNQLLYQAIMDVIRLEMNELYYENLEMVVPSWCQIKGNGGEKEKEKEDEKRLVECLFRNERKLLRV